MNDDRDAFEAAFVETLMAATPGATPTGLGEYMRSCRLNDEFYLMTADVVTGMANAAWWAWRARGRHDQVIAAASQETPHVVH